MSRKIIVSLLLIVFCVYLSGCSSDSDKFIGTWSGITESDMKITVIFSENDIVTMTLDSIGVSGTYVVEGDIATITIEDTGSTGTATISSETTLVFVAGGESVELEKDI